jgi:large conductance mechanosensitive channel
MKEFFGEFKQFISKGNVMSMAVGIIIGGAFTSIVNNVVSQLITPLLGLICGGIDFTSIEFKVGEATFGIGIVINSIVTFLMTAFVLFLIVKGVNKMTATVGATFKKDQEEAEPEPEPEPEPSDEVKLLMEIRDLLKNGGAAPAEAEAASAEDNAAESKDAQEG